MQRKKSSFTAIVLIGMLSFAAGVKSAALKPAPGAPTPTPVEISEPDYFPSHYVNQATEIEPLPAQF
jgi:hypothetical protein